MDIQEIIVAVILLVVITLVVRYIYQVLKKGGDKCSGCNGCPSSKTNNKGNSKECGKWG
ncbi:MAG: FeoB-associated Cys-rich membrane protein [Bacteroidales bacterium]